MQVCENRKLCLRNTIIIITIARTMRDLISPGTVVGQRKIHPLTGFAKQYGHRKESDFRDYQPKKDRRANFSIPSK